MSWLYQRNDSKSWWISFRQNRKLVLKSAQQVVRDLAIVERAKVEAMLALQTSNTQSWEFYEAISGTRVPRFTLKAGLASWLATAKGATDASADAKYAGVARELEAHYLSDGAGDGTLRDHQGPAARISGTTS